SGKNSLIFEGAANLGARSESGKAGTLLLDPKNIIVSTNSPGGGATNQNSTNVLGFFAVNPTEISWITPLQLSTLLGANSGRFQANNDIIFLDDVDSSGSTLDHDFTLQAGRSIFVGQTAPVSLTLHGQFLATVNDAGADPNNRDSGAAEFNMFAGSTI